MQRDAKAREKDKTEKDKAAGTNKAPDPGKNSIPGKK